MRTQIDREHAEEGSREQHLTGGRGKQQCAPADQAGYHGRQESSPHGIYAAVRDGQPPLDTTQERQDERRVSVQDEDEEVPGAGQVARDQGGQGNERQSAGGTEPGSRGRHARSGAAGVGNL